MGCGAVIASALVWLTLAVADPVVIGTFDLDIGGIAVTPERMRVVDLSQPCLLDDGEMSSYLGLPTAPPPDLDEIADRWL